MQEIVHPKGKIYYTMGEVAEMFDVNPSLLRYWEKEFDIIKPHRNKKGNRLFTPQDVDNIKLIYHLLKEKNMKIEVARKHLKDNKKELNRDAEIVERLMNIRAILLEIRDDLTYDGEVVDDDYTVAESSPAKAAGIVPGNAVPEKDGADAGPRYEHGAPAGPVSGPDSGSVPEVEITDPAEDGGAAYAAGPEPGTRPAVQKQRTKKTPAAPVSGSGFDLFGDPVGDTPADPEPDVTLSDIVSQAETGADTVSDECGHDEKPPFEEQMLFEVVPEIPEEDIDVLIDSFIAKNYDADGDEDQPEYDPFAGQASLFGGNGDDGGDGGDYSEAAADHVAAAPGTPDGGKDSPGITVIEQTLF